MRVSVSRRSALASCLSSGCLQRITINFEQQEKQVAAAAAAATVAATAAAVDEGGKTALPADVDTPASPMVSLPFIALISRVLLTQKFLSQLETGDALQTSSPKPDPSNPNPNPNPKPNPTRTQDATPGWKLPAPPTDHGALGVCGAVYCSRACRAADRLRHATVCQRLLVNERNALRAAFPVPLPPAAALLLPTLADAVAAALKPPQTWKIPLSGVTSGKSTAIITSPSASNANARTIAPDAILTAFNRPTHAAGGAISSISRNGYYKAVAPVLASVQPVVVSTTAQAAATAPATGFLSLAVPGSALPQADAVLRILAATASVEWQTALIRHALRPLARRARDPTHSAGALDSDYMTQVRIGVPLFTPTALLLPCSDVDVRCVGEEWHRSQRQITHARSSDFAAGTVQQLVCLG
jgi:hypothetical protein